MNLLENKFNWNSYNGNSDLNKWIQPTRVRLILIKIHFMFICKIV